MSARCCYVRWRVCRRQAGASLLEVLVALSLLATAMLGAAAAQIDALRNAELQVQREQAAWIGASLAEAMHAGDAATHVVTRAQAQANIRLPDARVQLLDAPGPSGAINVRWAHRGSRFGREMAPAAEACPASDDTAIMHCLVFSFASGE